MKPDASDIPKDIKRLRISPSTLRGLLSYFEIPPTFVRALSGDGLAFLPYQSRLLSVRAHPVLDVWYILPVRAEVECTEGIKSHGLSRAGSNQMDPSQYLHLNDVGKDVRPSRIALYLQHDTESHRTSAICVDFQDGRWWDLAEEPFLRARETLQRRAHSTSHGGTFFIHLLLFTSVCRWWRTALSCINQQIIAYVSRLYLPRELTVVLTCRIGKETPTADVLSFRL